MADPAIGQAEPIRVGVALLPERDPATELWHATVPVLAAVALKEFGSLLASDGGLAV